ncbi:MAG: hypothetical protein V1837_02255 [Candidatus Woesearchaeota archaeon]
MRSIVFDASPVISLAMNNLLWVLQPLKDYFGGDFKITPVVVDELFEKPLRTKKFKFEALQINRLIKANTLAIENQEKIVSLSKQLLLIANSIYSAKGHSIQIVHPGEMESLAACIVLGSEALVVDERTTRKLIEEPLALKKILEKKLHTSIDIDEQNLNKWKSVVSVKVLRSFELLVIAYELGFLNEYKPSSPNADQVLLEAVLWGLKLEGCAVSEEEIDSTIVSESRR